MYVYPDRYARVTCWLFIFVILGVTGLMLYSIFTEYWSWLDLFFASLGVSIFLKLLLTFLVMRIDLIEGKENKLLKLHSLLRGDCEINVSDISDWGIRRARVVSAEMRGYSLFRFITRSGKVIDYFAPVSITNRELFKENTTRIVEFVSRHPKDYGYVNWTYGLWLALII